MKHISLVAALMLAAMAVFPARADSDIPMRAAHGDRRAMHKFFLESLQQRPGAASTYEHQLREVFISVGNSGFAFALSAEPQVVRSRVMFFLNEAIGSH